jgi:hypothetical protein
MLDEEFDKVTASKHLISCNNIMDTIEPWTTTSYEVPPKELETYDPLWRSSTP